MQRPTSEAGSSPDGTDGGGDVSGWIDALYREHGRSVRAMCAALLRDRADAEDATQQSFSRPIGRS
jgi:hypothetical protein